jgi:transcriptional regulator with XRE-family HTH domain
MAPVRTDLRVAVGHRVRGLRLKLRISQEELAARAGLHRNYVGSVERGERDVGLRAIGRLTNALDITLADFFAPFRQKVRSGS